MKKVILLLLCFFFFKTAQAQVVADSLSQKGNKYVETQIDKVFEEKMRPIYFLGLPLLGGLTIYAIYLALAGIKKTVDAQIEKQAETLVEKKLSEKFGVRLETARAFFQDLEKNSQLMAAKRVLVVNKTEGKKINLEGIVRSSGITAPITFKLYADRASVDKNNYDILLIDNEDGNISEAEAVELFEMFKGSLRLVFFSSRDLSSDNFQKYKTWVKIAKLPERLASQIKTAFLPS